MSGFASASLANPGKSPPVKFPSTRVKYGGPTRLGGFKGGGLRRLLVQRKTRPNRTHLGGGVARKAHSLTGGQLPGTCNLMHEGDPACRRLKTYPAGIIPFERHVLPLL